MELEHNVTFVSRWRLESIGVFKHIHRLFLFQLKEPFWVATYALTMVKGSFFFSKERQLQVKKSVVRSPPTPLHSMNPPSKHSIPNSWLQPTSFTTEGNSGVFAESLGYISTLEDQWCGWELCSFAPVTTPNSDVSKSWNPPALPCSKVNAYKVSKDKIFKGSYSDYTILLNYTFLKESFLVARLQQSYHEIQKGFDRMRLAITLWMLHDLCTKLYCSGQRILC